MAEPNSEELALLDQEVRKSSLSMVSFSSGIRTLYSYNQVSGTDDQTKTFREVRDTVRLNAVTYKDLVLPVTQKAISAISDYMAYFQDFDFEDWVDCLDDIVKEIEAGVGYCEYLKQLHEGIIVDLKKCEDKAEVGKEELETSARLQEENARKLREEAKKARESAEWISFWGKMSDVLTFGLTLGLGSVIGGAIAKGKEDTAEKKSAKAVAEETNAKVGWAAVAITKNTIVPSIKDFLGGISACQTFLVATQINLEKMQKYGETGAQKRYYNAMKKRASLIQSSNIMFLTMMGQMRTDLDAIVVELSDKNYVDKWLEEQNEKFKEQHKPLWDRIEGHLQSWIAIRNR